MIENANKIKNIIYYILFLNYVAKNESLILENDFDIDD